MMQSIKEPSPFKVGDWVIYRPTDRTRGYTVMDEQHLVIGRRYRVAEIQDDAYVRVEGYNDPSGGLYWTNFEPG